MRLRFCAEKWFPNAFDQGNTLPTRPELAHLFAGYVPIADQIGSAEEVFKFEPIPNDDYIETARERAKVAMISRGMYRSDSVLERATESLRPIQTASAKTDLNRTPLVILESETGSGETEAALIRFVSLWKANLVDGLYFAVPTRAAAKQLQRRVSLAWETIYPDLEEWAKVVLAVPGYLKMGEVPGKSKGFEVFWVYPYRRGETAVTGFLAELVNGLSPQAWGTPRT